MADGDELARNRFKQRLVDSVDHAGGNLQLGHAHAVPENVQPLRQLVKQQPHVLLRRDGFEVLRLDVAGAQIIGVRKFLLGLRHVAAIVVGKNLHLNVAVLVRLADHVQPLRLAVNLRHLCARAVGVFHRVGVVGRAQAAVVNGDRLRHRLPDFRIVRLARVHRPEAELADAGIGRALRVRRHSRNLLLSDRLRAVENKRRVHVRKGVAQRGAMRAQKRQQQCKNASHSFHLSLTAPIFLKFP